jgi:DNA mismatch endonuclease, patch repair protein
MPSWRPTPKRPYKRRDAAVTSRMMSAVRSRENKAEVALRKALWRRGYRYRIQVRTLVGRPDLTLPKHRAVIFIDSDYWHGRALIDGGEAGLREVIRGPRFAWWKAKLSRNIERDREVTAALCRDGWRVIRVWESDIVRDIHRVASLIERRLRSRRP